MRFSSTQLVAYLVAISSFASVFASPTSQPAPTAVHHELDARATPSRDKALSVELEVVRDMGGTFVGTLVKRETAFNIPFSDREVQDAAIKTFDEWDKKQTTKDRSLLVAILAVPGHGLAAGTIWHGPDNTFENRVQQTAPRLATLIQRLQVQPGMQASKWHAEVVAAWEAESKFPGSKNKNPAGTQWPDGTKMITYGREGGEVGFKPACGSPNSSTNNISCVNLARAQNIKLVPIPDGCTTI